MARICLDKDGVQADFVGGFRAYLQSHGHLHPCPEPTKWNFASFWGLSMDEFMLEMKRFARASGYARLKPLGDLSVLRALKDAGHEIVVATNRYSFPEDRGRVAADSIQWLNDHNVPFDHFALVTDKRVIDADVFLDDGPSNIEALLGAGKRAIIFDQPYNQDTHCTERVTALKEFVNKMIL